MHFHLTGNHINFPQTFGFYLFIYSFNSFTNLRFFSYKFSLFLVLKHDYYYFRKKMCNTCCFCSSNNFFCCFCWMNCQIRIDFVCDDTLSIHLYVPFAYLYMLKAIFFHCMRWCCCCCCWCCTMKFVRCKNMRIYLKTICAKCYAQFYWYTV